MSERQTVQPESPQHEFEELYRDMFEFRRRMGLEPGNHVFENPSNEYARIELAPNAYDDMRVTFHSRPKQIATDAEGRPYNLKTVSEISRSADGSLRYYAMDLLVFTSPYSDMVFDSELNGINETFATANDAPEAAQKLIADAREILPTLTMQEYNEDESEWGPHSDKYDRALQRELAELDEAMSTAGGALAILQMTTKARRAQDGGDTQEFVVDNPERAESRQVTITDDSLSRNFDPKTWEPEIVQLKVKPLASQLSAQTVKFTHFVSYSISAYEGRVIFDATDTLENDVQHIELDSVVTKLQPDDMLPEPIKEVAKKMLDLIVNPLPEYMREVSK